MTPAPISSQSVLTPHPRRISNSEVSVEMIEKWRNNLHFSDLADSCNNLYLMLQDIYEADLTPKTRLEILSLLRPTLSYVSQMLKKFYNLQEVLTDQQQSIADLVFALNYEMLSNYKLIIEESKKHLFFSKKVLLTAFSQAMLFCTKILTHSYENHRQPPIGIWHELHSLFYLAQKKGLENKTVIHSTQWNNRVNTLQQIYAGCLLFSIINPYGLRKDEIAHQKYSIEYWTTLVFFKNSKENYQTVFVIDVNGDYPPQHEALYKSTSNDKLYLVLDKLSKHFLRLIAAIKSPNKQKYAKDFLESELMLPAISLEEIVNSWQHLSHRSAIRENVSGTAQVYLGLAASQWIINKSKSFLPAEKPTQSVTEVINIDILPNQGQDKDQKFIPYSCELIDKSEAGYRIKWLGNIPSQLQCGEIIALENSIHQQWEIGSVRWLKIEKNQEVYVGVQILNPTVIAVKVKLLSSDADPRPALILPNDPNTEEKIRLITSMLVFKVGQEVEIEYEEKTYLCVLQKNIISSRLYQEFELEFPHEPFIWN